MIHYRPFRNADPPAVAEIWRTRAKERGLLQPMSALVLDQLVFSKTYFDREGLILACDDGEPVGFVHAGFGPNETLSDLSTDAGVICMLIVKPPFRRVGIGKELLARGESYLLGRGASSLYAGGIRSVNPFYLGLYGGSDLPGVLESDAAAQAFYRGGGYVEVERTRIYRRDLAGFRPPVDRNQMQIRRQKTIQATVDPPTKSWWEACTWGDFERTRFDLLSREGGPPAASLTMWTMEPLSNSLGVRAAGLVNLTVDPAQRRKGLSTFLLGESFRQLQAQGIARINAQVMETDAVAIGLLEKLGFQQADRGTVFRKQVAAN